MELASSLQPLWLSRGRIQEGLAWFDAAFTERNALPEDVTPAVRARALADRAVLYAWIAIYHLEDAEEALSIARELDDPVLIVRALHACGTAAVYDADVAQRYFEEATGLARAVGDRWRLNHILGQQAHAGFVAGNPIAVRAAGQEGRDIADAIGDRFGSRQCRWRLAGAKMMEGNTTAAIAELRELMTEAEADHDLLLRANALLMLPWGLAYQGDVAEARTIAEAGIASAEELGDVYLGASYVGLMVAHLAAGDGAKAMEAADAGWSHLGDLYGTASINSAYIAHVALANGDLDAARRWADVSVSKTAGWYQVAALIARARIAIADDEPEQAERDGHEALTRTVAVGAYGCVSDILEILASLSAEAGSHHEAARLFGATEAIRQRTGDVRFAIYQPGYQASVDALRNTMGDKDFEAAWAEGAALSRDEAIAYAQRGRGERKRPSSGWGSLTPAELDVVRLVSEGLGNKDIATRLFVSPRTVQSHLTRVYTKLGLTSRVQLAQEATRRSPATNS